MKCRKRNGSRRKPGKGTGWREGDGGQRSNGRGGSEVKWRKREGSRRKGRVVVRVKESNHWERRGEDGWVGGGGGGGGGERKERGIPITPPPSP